MRVSKSWKLSCKEDVELKTQFSSGGVSQTETWLLKGEYMRCQLKVVVTPMRSWPSISYACMLPHWKMQEAAQVSRKAPVPDTFMWHSSSVCGSLESACLCCGLMFLIGGAYGCSGRCKPEVSSAAVSLTCTSNAEVDFMLAGCSTLSPPGMWLHGPACSLDMPSTGLVQKPLRFTHPCNWRALPLNRMMFDASCKPVQALEPRMKASNSFKIQQREFEGVVGIGNGLVNMCSKCGSLQDGRFRQVTTKTDVVNWNLMIAGYAQLELGQGVIMLLLFTSFERVPTLKLCIMEKTLKNMLVIEA